MVQIPDVILYDIQSNRIENDLLSSYFDQYCSILFNIIFAIISLKTQRLAKS